MDKDITELLQDVNAGTKGAFDLLVARVYDELRKMAGGFLRGPAGRGTLQPTALVHEAYMKLAAGESRWDSRAHFFGAAARAMRQVLVAEARRKAAERRAGGATRVTFDELLVQSPEPSLDLLAVDQALTALAAVDERFPRVLELRYFCGCTLEEIAEMTGKSLATVKRDFAYARAWLHDHMTGTP